MSQYLEGKKTMVWSFMGNARMYEALNKYGDRLDTVGIFTFEVDITGTIKETGTSISSMMPYINKWPHIKWLLTIMNHGTASIFTAIRNNTNGAKDKFLSEIVRIMNKYPWCDGVDIDLERGGGYENKDAANLLFKDIYQTVKQHDSSKLVNICLPGMTGVQGSVGGENWCVYENLDPYCDTAAIMSYGMAWAGSAPGPVSPRDWLEGIYNYATSVMSPKKIFLGLPGYGWNWRIDDTPQNLNRVYRGTSNTYYAAQLWMTGGYNFTNDAPPQPMIPIIAYWDDYDKVPWALPHVYDYMEGPDAVTRTNPLIAEDYNRRSFLTAYSKQQKTEFGNIYIDRQGSNYDSHAGIVTDSSQMVTLGENGETIYNFTLQSSGTYDIAVRIGFPFWDKNSIKISIDNDETTIKERRLWWPYWRTTCWLTLKKNISLTAGAHTIKVKAGIPGVQFYGFRVCSDFRQSSSAGEAEFLLAPRKFKGVNGQMVEPDRAFKLTTEVLRRKPDSALIWYEDFRDENPLPSNYWTTLSGEWEVWKKDDFNNPRPYAQLDGKGELTWRYSDFKDIHIRARIGFPQNGSGRAGVFCGDLFCCLNYTSQRLELYKSNSLLGSYNVQIERTSNANLRTAPNLYTIEMRIRNNSVRVYSGAANTFRFKVDINDFSGGYAGIRSDNRMISDLLRLGDAWTYEPYESVDITFPNGNTVEFGRIPRTGVTWDNEFQVFKVNNDVEEISTRNDDISMDYDFFHSQELPLIAGNDYTVKIKPKDINLWISRLFLGDADGFSILYYQDVDSLVYWANEAAYRWKLRGIAIWSLGQEDMRVWEALPKQI
ncbi:glycosyl hydrolase family 18 protein [Pseudogracilibacillus sp. SO10305]|uniref:glycosyl hydrolase family 18 protein n=1 Tax=Pseudogracilibacillus sp. SO10305 TaxID=3098292 RepID=UPI00300E6687